MRSDRLLIASDISLPFFFLFFPLILIVVYRMAIRYLIAILNRLNILDRALFQPKAFFFFFFGILIFDSCISNEWLVALVYIYIVSYLIAILN